MGSTKHRITNNENTVAYNTEVAQKPQKDAKPERRQIVITVAKDKINKETEDRKPPQDNIKGEAIKGKNKFIDMLKLRGIELIDNSKQSNIIWVLYRNDAQALVEQAATDLGFSCKLYKRGSEATNHRPAWMILIH